MSKKIKVRDQAPKSDPKGGRLPPKYVFGTGGGAKTNPNRPGHPVN